MPNNDNSNRSNDSEPNESEKTELELKTLELVRRIADPDDQLAWQELVDLWHKPFFSTAYRYLKNPEDAHDACQETYKCLVQNGFRTVDPTGAKGKITSWMFKILINNCTNLIKAKEKEREFSEDTDSQHTGIDTSQEKNLLKKEVYSAFARLDTIGKVALYLHHFKQWKYVQIAEYLDIPEGTVKSRIYKARIFLRRILRMDGRSP